MNQKTFEELIKDSMLLNKDTLSELEQLIKEYPFCQSFHLLYTKNLYQEKHIRYHLQLKLAAAIAGDRSRLKHYIEDSNEKINLSSEQLNNFQVGLDDYKGIKENAIIEDSKQTGPLKIIQESKNLNNELPIQSNTDLTPGFKPQVDIQPQADSKPESSTLTDKDPKYVSLFLSTLDANISREEKKKAIIELINKRFNERIDLIGEEKSNIVTCESETVNNGEIKQRINSGVIDKLVEDKEVSIESTEGLILDLLPDIDLSLPPVNDNTNAEHLESESENNDFDILNEQLLSSVKEEITSSKDLIERFLRDAPRISRPKKEFFNPVNLAARSLEENEGFYTETYASICLKQGNVTKALKIYEKLSLKFPEKSSYFAGLIEKIKKKQNI